MDWDLTGPLCTLHCTGISFLAAILFRVLAAADHISHRMLSMSHYCTAFVLAFTCAFTCLHLINNSRPFLEGKKLEATKKKENLQAAGARITGSPGHGQGTRRWFVWRSPASSIVGLAEIFGVCVNFRGIVT